MKSSSSGTHSPVSSNHQSSKTVVQQCLQNLNNRLLRKRHSVSILKFNNSNSSCNTPTLNSAQLSPSTNFSRFSSRKLSISNNKLNKSSSNTLLDDPINSCVGGSSHSRGLQKSTLMLPGSKNSDTLSLTSVVSSPFTSSKFKLPIKIKSNVSSRHGSFKMKRKTKRSKSAPINERKPQMTTMHQALMPSTRRFLGDSSNDHKNNGKLNIVFCKFCELRLQQQNQQNNLQATSGNLPM